MREVLIVRSVSFQQLDKNLPAIKSRFPDCRLSILTHEHGVKLAEKYADIHQVYAYPVKGGFSCFRQAKGLRGKSFDAVVIPVGNLTGLGFFNVLMFTLRISAPQRWVCNLVSDIRQIRTGTILRMGIKNTLYKGAALASGGVAALLFAVLMPLLFWTIRKKNEGQA
ncbi:MAG TPA: hypothetical protein VMS09_08200 [Paenibacillus sp.]|uniref:hypothetical protein n=1 Tax=Paenibacillus sp. TaxID=58172 RepID=UPI002D0084FC|nr:hypothetical protein [Paenibacillus sp.]HUC91995.1 hypothetical protein [Paenibacillus sp.]